MDVREKLIVLIAKAKYICANDYSDHTEDEYIADTLLDNGVTVQAWIPVNDRLPEPFVSVLVFRNGKISIDYHEENGWFAYDLNGKRATHWMQIPQPPKGGGNEV